jgi:3-phenylpropionate/trans-cinnamate dioxygenase ferredoxin reductase subunit
MADVLIIGAGGAGDAAAFALRKSGFDGAVTLLSADQDRPYDRPYLSKEFLRGEVGEPKVYLHPEDAYSENAIALRLGARVVAARASERTVELEDGATLRWDRLLIATGGTPRRLDGAPEADNVFTLRLLSDARALRQAIDGAERVLVIGAGFIGAEVAASCRALGKSVTMIEAAAVPLGMALGEEVGNVYARIHRDRGVDLRTGVTISRWHVQGGRVVAVDLADGSSVEADVVLVGVGIEPNLEVAQQLGLPISQRGVDVDAALRAGDGIYCAGDIARHPHPVLGRPIRVEHWEVAKNHGRAIARALAGQEQPYERLPYFWSDQYDVSLEYRGNASPQASIVWRGDPESESFTVFYTRDDLIDAVLSMNDGATNEAAGKLISSRTRVVASVLQDTQSDISSLATEAAQT